HRRGAGNVPERSLSSTLAQREEAFRRAEDMRVIAARKKATLSGRFLISAGGAGSAFTGSRFAVTFWEGDSRARSTSLPVLLQTTLRPLSLSLRFGPALQAASPWHGSRCTSRRPRCATASSPRREWVAR